MFLVLCIALLALVATSATVWWKYSHLFPKPSNETVQLDAHKRDVLSSLRKEEKFEPNEYPPLGYTDVATPEEGVVARAAVNDVLDSILSREDGPISASFVSDLIGRGMKGSVSWKPKTVIARAATWSRFGIFWDLRVPRDALRTERHSQILQATESRYRLDGNLRRSRDR